MAGEQAIRLGVFVGVFVAMALWEVLSPRRRQPAGRPIRWTNNIGVVVVDTLVVRVIFPGAAVGFAAFAVERGWGLFSLIDLPTWLLVIAAVVILDFVIYCQHVLFHAVPALWRLHRMHHADTAFDVTTALRFHPIEIVLSMGIKLVVVAALGPPIVAVLIFEIVLNAAAMFNHGNARIPPRIDAIVRLFLVTPDMHRVHHSVVQNETNSNYGFSVPWWDRLFGTYRSQPAAGHDEMIIGIEDFRDPRERWLDRMLIQPFRGGAGSYPINRR